MSEPPPLRRDMFGDECPSTLLPIRLRDKWAGMILRCLEDGPRRFTELRVPMHRVSPKVLTESLRALERDGFVSRTAYPENPPRVEYALTPLGRSLLEPLATACAWSNRHWTELRAARAAYERRAAGSAAGAP